MFGESRVRTTKSMMASGQTNANITKERRDADKVDLPSRPAEVLNYWNGIRGDDVTPHWDSFEMQNLPAELLPWAAVVDVAGPPDGFVYRYFGTARARYHGTDFTGRALGSCVDGSLAGILTEEYQAVVDRQSPLYIRTRGENGHGPIAYEFLRLPLACCGNIVDKIFSVGFSGEDVEGVTRKFDRLTRCEVDFIPPPETGPVVLRL